MDSPAADAHSELVMDVAPGVHLVRDTCNVYLVESRDDSSGEVTAIAIDFGSGRALSHLAGLGIARITDVLMTHHHRDQAQGLPLAIDHGARIHVPPTEVGLFDNVEEFWRTRQLDIDYNLRQDRFSLLESVAVDSTVPVYRTALFGGVPVRALPTPGHTLGSVSYLVERQGQLLAFTGDLIYAPGKVWSLASTQWSYSENEGPAMTVLSALLLAAENPAMLLPSHGDPMASAAEALAALAGRMQEYVDSRRPRPWDLRGMLEHPFERISEHLLLNRSSMSCSYVLLSGSGAALFIDFGYDMMTGLIGGGERSSRLPWLACLGALKRDFGVTAIEVALPTHYHDDHVAGMNLLREVEGTEVWVPSSVAPVLADPWRYDLPCQWFDPIPADRVLPEGHSFTWREYTITVHPLPGHTRYAAAFEVEIDGVVALFTGDQQTNEGQHLDSRSLLNYQYRNQFDPADFRDSAALYRRVAPGLLLSGHWTPQRVTAALLDELGSAAERLEVLHEVLMPAGLRLNTDGIQARIEPYRARVLAGASASFEVSLSNPLETDVTAILHPVVPLGWRTIPERIVRVLGPGESARVEMVVQVGDAPVTRARIAIDVSFGSMHLGQQTEALIDVE